MSVGRSFEHQASATPRTPPRVLVIGGLDPSGGAGLLADAEAVHELGAHAVCVPTALTVQGRKRAHSFEPVSVDYLRAAILALLDDEEMHAVKIGQLASPVLANALVELLRDDRLARLPLVLDPVLTASSGASLFLGSLADARASVRALWEHAVLTPNALEAQLLLVLPAPPRGADELEQAARAFIAAGARAVLCKGGHAGGTEAIDLLAERGEPLVTRLVGPRLFAPATGGAAATALQARGTGCRLASALAAGLALGLPLPHAAASAKSYVERYIAHSA